MTIDMHSHWKPAALADAMRSRETPPRIVRNDDGSESFDGRFGVQKLAEAFDDVAVRLAAMDRLASPRP